ncbi:efflux RND transporter periplasmic adaptor subunit [soil metagenome]
MKKVLLTTFLLLLLGMFGYVGYYLFSKSQKDPVVYETSKPFKTDIIVKTVANGAVEPRREVTLKPQISGIIDELFVEAGQKVKKGQKIARIKIIPDDVNLSNAESSVNKTKMAMEQAKLEYERRKQLFEAKAISDIEYKQYLFQYQQSKEDYENALNTVQLIKEGISSRSKQTTTIVLATIDGMVLDVPVKVGTQVIQSNNFNEGTTVAIIADMSDLIFKGNIDESEVGKIKVGMPLRITIGAIENRTFNATLEYISPKGITDQGTIKFEIKAALTQPEDVFIRAGMSANADIILEKRDSVLALQERDLIVTNDTNYVEIETAPQQFQKQVVKTGLSDGINVELLEGIDSSAAVKKQQ